MTKKPIKTNPKKLPTMAQVLKIIRKEDSWSNDFWKFKEEVESDPRKKEESC
jgi:hypothetical protein